MIYSLDPIYTLLGFIDSKSKTGRTGQVSQNKNMFTWLIILILIYVAVTWLLRQLRVGNYGDREICVYYWLRQRFWEFAGE